VGHNTLAVYRPMRFWWRCKPQQHVQCTGCAVHCLCTPQFGLLHMPYKPLVG
jgi:hypothetical protein